MTEITHYVLLRHRDIADLNQLDVYRQQGGFEAFRQAVTSMQPGQVTDVVELAGRPEALGVLCEEILGERHLDDPGLLLHLRLELAGAPARVSREHA